MWKGLQSQQQARDKVWKYIWIAIIIQKGAPNVVITYETSKNNTYPLPNYCPITYILQSWEIIVLITADLDGSVNFGILCLWVGFVPFSPLWSVSSLFSDCPQVSKMQWMGMLVHWWIYLVSYINIVNVHSYPKSFKTPQLWTFLHYLYSTVSRFSRSRFRSCILSKYSKLWSLSFSCTQIHVLNLTANPITTILARDWPTYVRESSYAWGDTLRT